MKAFTGYSRILGARFFYLRRDSLVFALQSLDDFLWGETFQELTDFIGLLFLYFCFLSLLISPSG